jgi:NAD(P)-dependent dehydrogenase (short-subunit alcohol dehydrogenase family)
VTVADNTGPIDLHGRRALVTGGASGIGNGTARRLVEHGADVVVGDVDEDRGRSVAAELGAAFTVLDVADPVYGLTKHAVVGFVRSLATALDRRPGHDVCISAICPGFTDTDILTPELKQTVREQGLEIMAPEHVGDVVVRAVRERVNGAQWVIWPGVDVAPYDWNPAIRLAEPAP